MGGTLSPLLIVVFPPSCACGYICLSVCVCVCERQEGWWVVCWLVPGMFHDLLPSREGPRQGSLRAATRPTLQLFMHESCSSRKEVYCLFRKSDSAEGSSSEGSGVRHKGRKWGMLEESRASQSRQEPSAEDHLSRFSVIRTRAAADSGRGSDARLQRGRPTYVPSVPQPPQMAITVSGRLWT
ncbi:hypothetical protein CHARACLAT_002693 [Characodon lateralis]|uniref:Uncharacterized protein n=1 Tax=Characodon lateralis TaxID=208331 RepID=A0ABU7CNY1_9TELE|nr:hypothetical protein [Characodon lateralis]